MIRQAISCDICGTEKRLTNHWFVAYEHAGELRLSGWSSGRRLRAESKHLCGQTCLHKLVDEFMARSLASPARPAADEDAPDVVRAYDTGVAADPARAESESAARLIASAAPAPTPPAHHPRPEIVTLPLSPNPAELPPGLLEIPRRSSRTWRTEAWERERERELRTVENRPDVAPHRRPNSHRVM